MLPFNVAKLNRPLDVGNCFRLTSEKRAKAQYFLQAYVSLKKLPVSSVGIVLSTSEVIP